MTKKLTQDDSTHSQDRPVPILYLIRGLPGSGKSRLASSMGCFSVAPSDMMSHRGGKYIWQRDNYLISKIHFRDIVKQAMSLQIDICVTELLMNEWFLSFWLDTAMEYYYKVKIITLITDPEIALKRNVHQVGQQDIKEIHDQFNYGIYDQEITFEWEKNHTKSNQIKN